MQKIVFILFIGTLAALSSCKKEEGVDVLAFEPSIEIVSLNTTNLIEFDDSLIITLKYEDGDGDLGRFDPDENSLYIKDSRLSKAEYYHIPPILADDDNLQTTGKIRVFIPTLFILGTDPVEKAEISLKVRDQAGNWSNEVKTGNITINRKN